MKEIRIDVNMILAGDIGGTKALVGLFDARPGGRPTPIAVRAFPTREFADLTPVIARFLGDEQRGGETIAVACFGVAGPILGETAELTNVRFHIDGPAIARAFAVPRVQLLNDLQAMAHALPWLEAHELHTLQEGTVLKRGAIGLIAAGTGLGEAVLQDIDGRMVATPTEAGHADWAARNDREIAVLRRLLERGRVEVEGILSGPGLASLHRTMHTTPCAVVEDNVNPGAAAAITQSALDGRCSACVEVLDLFVRAYGAEAGNLALRAVTTGGLFVGGGIAPKILPAIADGRFLEAFLDKDPFRDMLARIPVKVVLNPEAGLMGAAVAAAGARSA